ncbi:cytochrome P450 [Rhodococcus sp. D2-41]|uniref:Cytochrome P450 n=1 Tax=Speluncibacter jeojiensis TaxID=2710754 RepID=A0A9X4LZQ2_9ACTN|nr:cytochrome P450 [Rhodococcus sp. D2-41]MDG3010603.1 cytochrome P450 [Rhodococcus sp. D2-41]MDG3014350.1 cytochrome P450 [Corynebacteriales bacterium D3-21]
MSRSAPGAAPESVVPDLTDLDLFVRGFPYDAFARLREQAPVWWHEPTAHTPAGEGFWVVSRYRDVVGAGGDTATFSSDGTAVRDGGGTLIEDLPAGLAPGHMLNMTDPPRHPKLRRLLHASVAPRVLARIEDDLRERAVRIVDAAVAKGECDFLLDVAAELPLQAVAQLLGVPQQDRHRLFEWATATLDYADRDLGEVTELSRRALSEMQDYGRALLERKRADPGDDLMSVAATATIDDEPLADLDQRMVFSLLLAAGSETTRNAIAGGMLAFAECTGIWEDLHADRTLLAPAVEEILRWTSPTPYNRRTATADVELAGVRIRAGEKVTLWWASANRDAAVFPDPDTFDIRRTPNPHVAFGRGPHFCLGSVLARMEIRVVLEALLDRVAGFEVVGPVERVRSNKHTGIRRLPMRLEPR